MFALAARSVSRTARRRAIGQALALPLAALAVTGLVGCDAGTPVPSEPATPAAAATTSGAPAPAPADAAAPSTVLGPDGLGALKLGMSKKAAEATGLITAFANPDPSVASDCPARAKLKDEKGLVWWSTRLGVAAIEVPEGIRTAEGIGVGSTRDSVGRAYPTWRGIDGTPPNDTGHGRVPVSGNPDAVYRIDVQDGTVRSVTLQLAHQDCYE
ncbi:hypothetical protein ACIBPB_25530 [Micromonospora sp. NPDC049836]|uniref:hypothetical protein n=1 Tax=Micromonospora sp. NPDC049836 TaxID=3364274 RepID=UPI00378BCA0C